MSILKLFCHVDDFCQWLTRWENAKLLGMTRKRGPAPRMSMSEMMTILIHFHQSHYRDFKAYYSGISESEPVGVTQMISTANPVDAPTEARRSLYERFASRISVKESLSRKLVSYQGNKEAAGLRWMKYKEGFSAGLVQSFLGQAEAKTFLDPFSGSGAVPLTASRMGMDGRPNSSQDLDFTEIAGRRWLKRSGTTACVTLSPKLWKPKTVLTILWLVGLNHLTGEIHLSEPFGSSKTGVLSPG